MEYDKYHYLLLEDYKNKSENRVIPFETMAMLRVYAKVAMQQNARYKAFVLESDTRKIEMVWE